MAVYGANYLEVVPDLIDREPEWKMEAVLDSRWLGQKDKLQYLIK